jgi:hypothetical protein
MFTEAGSRLKRLACAGAIAFLVFLALCRPATAQVPANPMTFKLSSVKEVGPGLPKPLVSGNWTLTSLNPTQTGGTATAVFHVTSGLGPGNVPCAGHNQNVSFKWIFNRDPTYITTSEPLSIQLMVQADSGACAPNNPYIFTTPMGYFQQTPAMDEAQNRVYFQPPAGFKNQPIRSIEATEMPYAAGFSVLLNGNTANPQGALAIEIDYNYLNVPAAAPQPPPAVKPGCTGTGWVVSPMSGATLDENQISTDGATCPINITTKLPQASVQIATPPGHGTLTQTGILSLVYKPTPGFKGVDHYSFRYCGSNGSSSGCATLNYTVQVE